MLEFVIAIGFESSIKEERSRYDAYVAEYAGKVITVRATSEGWVAWVWEKGEGGKLESCYKMKGIVRWASDFPVVVSETKKHIDSRNARRA